MIPIISKYLINVIEAIHQIKTSAKKKKVLKKQQTCQKFLSKHLANG